MSEKKISVVTFDLWDTVFINDSDEPKRQSQGLAPKPVERRNLVESFLNKHKPVPRELIDIAYSTTDAAFRHVWYGQNITWTVKERLSVLLRGLGCELPNQELNELIRLHEEMELAVMPDLAPNISEALAGLHGKYRLGVISDTIFSPGRVLKQILDHYGILKHFDVFVFSDEIGFAKPSPIVFEKISEGLNVPMNEIVHVGDREEKDVNGPHVVGAKAVFTNVVLDRGSKNSKAEAVCDNYSHLVNIINNLNN